MDRRTLFKWLIHSGSLVVAAVIGIPSLVAGFSPAFRRRRADDWRPVLPLDTTPVGQVREGVVDPSVPGWPAGLGSVGVYVWRRTAEEVVVFSRSCTDLGCPVTFDPGSACYFCPCHGGIFAANGDRMAGPPNRPLDRYAVRVRDGTVEINLGSVPPMS